MKILLSLLAFINPETVIWTAYNQLAETRALCKALNATLARSEGSTSQQKRANGKLTDLDATINTNRARYQTQNQVEDTELGTTSQNGENWSWTKRILFWKSNGNQPKEVKWSLDMAFFAVMGGFVFEYDDWTPSGTAATLRSCSALTPQAVLLLANLGLFPDLKGLKETIEDKSKSDSFAKGLVCVQVLWFFIQVFGRIANRLPITLLELNTVAHVSCALVLYIIWWYKPQDVHQPIVVDLDEPVRCFLLERYWIRKFEIGSEVQSITTDSNEVVETDLAQANTHPPSTSRTENVDVSFNSLTQLHGQTPSSDHSPESRNTASGGVPAYMDGIHLSAGQRFEQSPFIAKSDLDIWSPFLPIVRNLDAFCRRYSQLIRDHVVELTPDAVYTSYEVHNFYILGRINTTNKENWDKNLRPSLPVLGVLSLFYGAIHATSWNGHFPSSAEKTMWRVSVCVVASGGIVLSLLLWSAWFLPDGGMYDVVNQRYRRIWKYTWCRSYFWLGLVVRIWIIVYATGRLFLNTEAFISVRSLPIGAYNITNWGDVFPHLG